MENDQTKHFIEKNYVVIKNVIDPSICWFVTNHILLYNKVFGGSVDDQCGISPSFYGLETTETLLVLLNNAYVNLTNKKLMPTYSYCRIYNKDETLEIHKDRYECDYSATICLGKSNNNIKDPIYLSNKEDKSDKIEINLDVGDALFYRGCKVWHWRDAVNNDWMTQVFLHYIEDNFKNTNKFFDGRKDVLYPPTDKNQIMTFKESNISSKV